MLMGLSSLALMLFDRVLFDRARTSLPKYAAW
jgi:hypothetical protein